jgi:peptide/nickel transport system permease protein
VSPLLRYVLRRLVLSAITLIGVAIVVFLLTRILPSDPAALRAGPLATAETIAAFRTEMGLDQPVLTQFANYASLLLRADLGISWRTEQPILEELGRRLPATLELALAAFLLALTVGLTLGILAAVYAGGCLDQIVRGFATLGASLALFWLALVGIQVFYSTLGWAPPPLGRFSVGLEEPPRVTGLLTLDSLLAGNLNAFAVALHHLWLPAGTLAFIVSAPIIKITRGAMLDALGSDYVRTARAIGLPAWHVIMVDALRNALIPVLTTLGVVFGYLMAGNVIVERVFSWNGIGFYAWNALVSSDFNAVQGFVLLIAVTYVTLNLCIDLAYGLISPRIRLG